jgi:hypothetical protein
MFIIHHSRASRLDSTHVQYYSDTNCIRLGNQSICNALQHQRRIGQHSSFAGCIAIGGI